MPSRRWFSDKSDSFLLWFSSRLLASVHRLGALCLTAGKKKADIGAVANRVAILPDTTEQSRGNYCCAHRGRGYKRQVKETKYPKRRIRSSGLMMPQIAIE